jgi:hypothetical protein
VVERGDLKAFLENVIEAHQLRKLAEGWNFLKGDLKPSFQVQIETHQQRKVTRSGLKEALV